MNSIIIMVFLVLKVDNDLGVTKIEIDLLYITGTSISPDTKLSIIGNLEKYSATGLILTSMIVIDLR
jgi:uncharacterized protein YdeI (BOF family)